MSKNRIKSGPGPLRVIYEKISALEYEVHELKSELRLVKRKFNNYERTSSVSVKDVLADRIREQPFTLLLTPASDDSINIVQPFQMTTQIQNLREHQLPRKLRVNQRIFEENQTIVPDNSIHVDEGPESDDTDIGNYEAEDDEKPIRIVNVERTPRSPSSSPNPHQNPGSEIKKSSTKPLDPIWNEYKISIGSNGKRQATCRRCEKSISGQAPRLRSHFYERCTGPPGAGSHNNTRTHKMPRSPSSKSIATESRLEGINDPNANSSNIVTNPSTPATKRKRNDLNYSDPLGKEG